MPSICRDCATPTDEIVALCPRCGSDRLLSHPELFDLTIAHVDCDAFYASVEKRDNPEIRDKPVIVGHAGGRGVVTTACYIARRYGPRSAMPMFKAMALCPDAVVIAPDMVKYKRASASIRALFAKATPVFEPVSLDEAYLDLSDEVRLIGRPPAVILCRLARAIERDVGVTVSVGLSYNKSLAKLASDRDKPRGFSVVGRGEAREILAQLPVTAIHGIGKATARRLAEDGITGVDQLQAMPEAALTARLGKFGRTLSRLVHGDDPRQVVADRPCKSVSTETTFARDLPGFSPLAQSLQDLASALETRLKRAGLAGETVVLKLKTADFQSLSRQVRLPCATQQAGVLFDHALPLLRREADGRAFRLIGIGVDHLVPAEQADPPDLFGLVPACGKSE
ncbi:DNA polymerase IV [Telmatospirillum sp.]|uniref:DNA polymerase IV n=1 Tax=Telmatospirillum sp. TaxID=2079197 RepID=UPI00283CD62B|nr:DNA polymerase IV [Telmatospirillum sp.]MDR3437043.1 DNA polymerase IV [Telmatospirillum sp.]